MTMLYTGFSLIEMMVALLIIAILATIAVPQYGMYMSRDKVAQAAELAESIRADIRSYYQQHQSFPRDNADAGVPPEDKLLGNYVEAMRVENGAVHIHLGNKASEFLQDRTLTMRPITVDGSPDSPISWICGNASVPDGMSAKGVNRTDIKPGMLPLSCRR
jgi:type IV pilus assembly protein PilA